MSVIDIHDHNFAWSELQRFVHGICPTYCLLYHLSKVLPQQGNTALVWLVLLQQYGIDDTFICSLLNVGTRSAMAGTNENENEKCTAAQHNAET